MVLRRACLAFVLASLTLTADGDILGGAIPGFDWGASEDSVLSVLQESCAELSKVAVEPAKLPIAQDQEVHLVCRSLGIAGDRKIGEAAFTLADGRLAMIEARQGAIEALIPAAGEKSASLGGYNAYLTTWTFGHSGEDVVWVMSEEAARAHLFLWRNPALPGNASRQQPWRLDVSIPEILELGSSLETMTERLESACQGIVVEEIARPWLPSKPQRQTQINCFGYPFAGFPRKIEAVFGDGSLELAWILTGKGEEGRLRQALIRAHGPADTVSQDYEAFAGGRIALRKDLPEILVLSEALIPLYRETFEGK